MSGGTAIERPSKFAGHCRKCGKRYEVGELVVMRPPKGTRRRWLIDHKACALVERAAVRWVRPTVHFYDWMTPAERVMYREACAKGLVGI